MQGEILRVLKYEIAKVEDGAEPVKLGSIQVGAISVGTGLDEGYKKREGTDSMPRTAASPRVVLSIKVILLEGEGRGY